MKVCVRFVGSEWYFRFQGLFYDNPALSGRNERRDDFDVVTVHDSTKLQYFYGLILNHFLEVFLLLGMLNYIMSGH